MDTRRTQVHGGDGAEEHELGPWQNAQVHTQEQLQVIENRPQILEDMLDPPPPYSRHSEPSEPTSTPLPTLVPDHRSGAEGRIHQENAANSGYHRIRRICVIVIFILVVVVVAASVMGSTMTMKKFFGDSETAANRSDISTFVETREPQSTTHTPDVEASSPVFSAMSGFYLLPGTMTNAVWLQAEREPSAKVKGVIAGAETLSIPSISTTSFVQGHVRRPGAIGQSNDLTNDAKQDEILPKNWLHKERFNRWGVKVLHKLQYRGLGDRLQIEKAWCIANTCSGKEKLGAMCNDSGKDVAKGKKKNPAQQQECDWCWDEKIFPERNSLQEAKIQSHCENVSHRTAITLLIVCCLLVTFVLTLLTALVIRSVSHKTDVDPSGPGPSPLRGGDQGAQESPFTRFVSTHYMKVRQLIFPNETPSVPPKPKIFPNGDPDNHFDAKGKQTKRNNVFKIIPMNVREQGNEHKIPSLPLSTRLCAAPENRKSSHKSHLDTGEDHAQNDKAGSPQKSSKRLKAVSSDS